MEGHTSTQILEHELSIGEKLLQGPLITATGRIELSACKTQVTKKSIIKDMPKFWRSIQKKQLQREIDTYKHLPEHPRFVPVVGFSEDGDDAYLTIQYMLHGSLATYLRMNETAITIKQRIHWILQTAQGVAVLHANGVIHADLKPTNLLLDENLQLRIADFGGCSLLGQAAYILESGPFYLPATWREEDEIGCNVATDLFALGACTFQTATGKQPYEGMEDAGIEKKFACKEFPSLDGVLFGQIVMKCWLSEFSSAEAVLNAMVAEVESMLGDPEICSTALRCSVHNV